MDEKNKNCHFYVSTSLKRAMGVYTKMQYAGDEYQVKTLFRDAYLKFFIPDNSHAQFVCERDTPRPTWFISFDETEKIIETDEAGFFYGIRYTTKIILAKDRLHKFINNFDNKAEKDKSYIKNELELIYDALSLFCDGDELTLWFIFPEWPNSRKAEKDNYVQQMEHKILGFSKVDM